MQVNQPTQLRFAQNFVLQIFTAEEFKLLIWLILITVTIQKVARKQTPARMIPLAAYSRKVNCRFLHQLPISCSFLPCKSHLC